MCWVVHLFMQLFADCLTCFHLLILQLTIKSYVFSWNGAFDHWISHWFSQLFMECLTHLWNWAFMYLIICALGKAREPARVRLEASSRGAGTGTRPRREGHQGGGRNQAPAGEDTRGVGGAWRNTKEIIHLFWEVFIYCLNYLFSYGTIYGLMELFIYLG